MSSKFCCELFLRCSTYCYIRLSLFELDLEIVEGCDGFEFGQAELVQGVSCATDEQEAHGSEAI